MKKLISLLVAVCMIATSFCIVHADTAFDPTGWNDANGYYWKIDGTTLYLHYTTTAPNYTVKDNLNEEDRPWIVANANNRTSITSAVMTGKPGQIGERTFFEMSSLTNIEFPEDIWTIGAFAFKGCPLTGAMIIPGTVTFVGAGAFNGNSNASAVKVGSLAGLPKLGNITLMRPIELYNVGNKVIDVFGAKSESQWGTAENAWFAN